MTEKVGSSELALGKRLQKARQSAGLTQQQMCHKTGLSYSTLAKIERGAIKSPSIFTIQQIATALHTSLDELIGHEHAVTKSGAKSQSKSGVRFVFFDINGCLVRFFHRAFSKLAAETGETADVIETVFWHYNDAVCRGEMTLKEFNQKLAQELNIESLDWQKYYLDAIDPIPQMHDLVRWAVERYHVGLMSNIMPGFINVMKEKHLIPDVKYATVIDSSEVGTIKPERRIYEIAQENANVPGDEILLVDDSRANIMAAERLGWHVIWFDDFRPAESAKNVRNALEPA